MENVLFYIAQTPNLCVCVCVRERERERERPEKDLGELEERTEGFDSGAFGFVHFEEEERKIFGLDLTTQFCFFEFLFPSNLKRERLLYGNAAAMAKTTRFCKLTTVTRPCKI